MLSHLCQAKLSKKFKSESNLEHNIFKHNIHVPNKEVDTPNSKASS